jgi:molybdate transport system substrate-binding protein
MMKTRCVIALALLLAAIGCGKKKAEDAPKDSAKSTEGTAAGGETAEPTPAEGTPLRVAGASDLVAVMAEIEPRFEEASGAKVDFIPGSSGKLAAQIREGAPFDVYMSANAKFVDDVVASGECLAETKRLYARGRLVMWVPEGAKEGPPATLAGLADGKYETIAIAQPDHAPYGAAAKEALEKTDVWKKIEKRVVYGSNIKDTMQMVETRNADIGMIALSLAIKAKGKYVEVPADLHGPIDQGLAVCKNGKQQELGKKFVQFIFSPEIGELMTSYGLPPPPSR